MTQSHLTYYNPNPDHQPPRLSSSEAEPGYGQLLKVLMQRKGWVIGIFLATLAATSLITLVMKPKYRSTMQVMLESSIRGRRLPNDTPSFADPNVEIDNATQLNVMRSNQLLQRALTTLKPKYRDLDIEKLKKKLTIIQIQEQKGNERVNTSIFNIEYVDSDREKTREVVRALRDVYQQYSVEQQKTRLSKGLSFIDAQIPQAEARVNQSELALEKFRASQDLIDPELQARSLVDSLSTLQKEQQANRGQLAALQTQYGALQAQLGRSPQQAAVATRLSQSQRVQSMMNEIQAAEVTLQQQRLRFTDKTPQIQVLAQNLQNLKSQLSLEASKVIGDASATSADAQLGQNDQKFASDLVESQVGFMAAQAKEQTLSATEAQLRGQLKRFPMLLAEFNRLQPNVKINRETLEQLLKAKQDLGLEIARGALDWQVIEEPRLGKQIGPSWLKNLLAGSVVGLMLGSLVAFLRDSQDDSVRSSEDLAKQTPLPLLGMVPELPLPEVAALPINFPFQRPTSLDPSMLQVLHWAPFRESLDLIYKNLQLLTDGSPMKSLVITSALAGEGKSTVALGLAISAARLHQRVLLIDGDLRRPGLHKQLELPNDQGLSTLLTSDRLPSHGAIQNANTYSDLPISVLTAGPTPLDSVKLLSSNRMRELMSVFEQNYDLVIVDSPPVLGIVDAILAASFCDGALLVGRMGHVNRQEVAQAASTMNRLNLLGIIANGATPMANYYYPGTMV